MKTRLKSVNRSLWAIVLAFLMIISSFTVLAVTVDFERSNANIDLKSSSSTHTLYLDTIGFCETNQDGDGWEDCKNTNVDRFAVCTQGSDGDKWYSMSKVNGYDHLFSVTINDNNTKVNFCRMNGSNTTNSWDNKWNNFTINDFDFDDYNTGYVTDWNSGSATNTETRNVYYNDSVSKWSDNNGGVYLIQGSSHAAVRFTMNRVLGTQYLFKSSILTNNQRNKFYFTKIGKDYLENINKLGWMNNREATHHYATFLVNNRVYGGTTQTSSGTYENQNKTFYNNASTGYATYTVSTSVTGSGTLSLKNYDNQTVSSGTAVPMLTVIKPTATPSTNYKLISLKAGSTSITSESSNTISSNTTFTAIFESDLPDVAANLDVTIGGSAPYRVNEEVTLGYTGTVEDGATFTYEYKKSSDTNWTTATNGKFTPTEATTYNVRVTASKSGYNSKTSSSRNVVVRATYTITYDNLNDGTITGDYPTSYTYSVGATLPTASQVTRNHYTFAGWYGNSSLSGTAITAITTTDTGNKTYYAKWTPDQYGLTLNLNGGSLSVTRPTQYNYGERYTLPIPTRGGYTFKGWYDNESFTGDAVTRIPADATGAKTYYAKWEKIPTYTINVVTNGTTEGSAYIKEYYDTNGAKQTVNGSNTYQVSALKGTQVKVFAPTIRGYNFLNFSSDVRVGPLSDVDGTLTFNVTADETITANYEEKTTNYAIYGVQGSYKNGKWNSWTNATRFNADGEAEIIISNTNQEFRLIDKDRTDYGAKDNNRTITDAELGSSTFKTTKGEGHVYNVSSTGKYIITITDIDDYGVPTFSIEKIEEYYEFAVVGSFNGWKGSYSEVDENYKFDGIGSSVIVTFNNDNASDNQFRLINGSGTQYGKQGYNTLDTTVATEQTNQVFSGFQKGIYQITLMGVSSGVPSIKISSAGRVSLMYYSDVGDAENRHGFTLPGFFTSLSQVGDTNVYETVYHFTEGTTLWFAVFDNGNYYFAGGDFRLDTEKSYFTYGDKYEGAKLAVTETGDYRIRWNSSTKKLIIFSAAKALAGGVTIEAADDTVAKGRTITLTATLVDVDSDLPENAELTYTFTNKSGAVVKQTTTKNRAATVTLSATVVGENKFNVTVSTSAAYTDSNTSITYASVSSTTPATVNVSDASIYYATVSDGEINDTKRILPNDFILRPTVSSGGTYTFALFDDPNEITDEYQITYPVVSSNNRYCTVKATSNEDGVPYYVVKCNPGCTNPTIYVYPTGIYAVATLSPTKTSTIDNNDEKVTYYFAKLNNTASLGASKTDAGSTVGCRIKYWNNSYLENDKENSIKLGTIDVTTPVNVKGSSSTSATNTNTIYVKPENFVGASSFRNYTGLMSCKIYKAELPVWATSFNFVAGNGDDSRLTVDNTCDSSDTKVASLSLNPNRIYILFDYKIDDNSSYYVRGVPLDESFWDYNARKKADGNKVNTEGFSSNLVDYHTSDKEKFNKALTTAYGDGYEHPLYFNSWHSDNLDLDSLYNSNHFKMYENIAMRWDSNHAYYASIQNLVDYKLSTTKKNAQGEGLLLGYNGKPMPLFDYDNLKKNDYTTTYKIAGKDSVIENVDFPFYETTFDGVVSYSYDSATDLNREYKKTSEGKDEIVISGYMKKGNSYGYLPFGDNYGFGTEFDIDFYMTRTGKLSTSSGGQQDIVFDFSGDDDVWVFVDGVKVLDLGGAHKVSAGSINFSDMKVYYRTAANDKDAAGKATGDDGTNVKAKWATQKNYINTVNLSQILAANGVNFNNKDTTTRHTLQMFYMERGEGESNCSVSFNLPQNTGLRISNQISADSVNPGLYDATLRTANKDYFKFSIADRWISNNTLARIKAQYPNAPDAALKGTATAAATNYMTDPEYPITGHKIVNHLDGYVTDYYLTQMNTPEGGTKKSSTDWLDALDATSQNDDTIRSWVPLKQVTYSIDDKYAENAIGDEIDCDISGITDDDGYFFLLNSQSALFESKVPNNTGVRIGMSDDIRGVEPGDGENSVIQPKPNRERFANQYYRTSYEIYDDDTKDVLFSSEPTAVKGHVFATDDDIYAEEHNYFQYDENIANGGFYFANYTGDTRTNAATVTFTNDVITSKIVIGKTVPSGASATDKFQFTVEFQNIFGNGRTDIWQEFDELTYTVYNKSDNSVVKTGTYGKAGILIAANQYAVIDGIPVGTSYKISEAVRAGYQCKSVDRITYFDDEEIWNTPTTFDADSSTFEVSGRIPATGEEDDRVNHYEYDFTNEKIAFTVKFKYYGRSVQTGLPTQISESAKTLNVPISETKTFTDSDGNVQYDFDSMIARAAIKANIPTNIIDSYHFENTQAGFLEYIKSQKILDENIKKTSGKANPTYGDVYSEEELAMHTDCYGRVYGTPGCRIPEGKEENWVTYYNGNDIIEESAATGKNPPTVTSLTIWLYNTLKEYHPTFNYAPASASDNSLKQVGDKYVATGTTKKILNNNVYYNIRLGGRNGNNQRIDAATSYLEKFGITSGYCDEIPELATNVTYKSNNLRFLYWSSDPNGKTILTTDIDYGFRVTNSFKAYAVYGTTDISKKGITLTANDPDYYYESTGTPKVRLNNMMNVYNCKSNDNNIKNTSIVYVIDYTNGGDGGKIANLLNKEGGYEALQEKIREIIKKNEGVKQYLDGYNIVIDDLTIKKPTSGYGDVDIAGINYQVVPYGEFVEGTGTVALSNKNRLQFTTAFWQSDIYSTDMYAFAAMDYVTDDSTEENTWIVSDNCIHYNFDEKSVITKINDPINDVTFYQNATEDN